MRFRRESEKLFAHVPPPPPRVSKTEPVQKQRVAHVFTKRQGAGAREAGRGREGERVVCG